MIRVLCAWCIMVLAVSGCSSQRPASQDSQASGTGAEAPETIQDRVDVSKLGPQVGEQVPDFSLEVSNVVRPGGRWASSRRFR